jgi:transaldolase
MKFFLDSANLDDIQKMKDFGILSGITTNPSIIANEKIKGRKAFLKHIKEMCEVSQVPVSAEVVGIELNEIIDEGEELSSLDPNVVVKIPVNENGIKAMSYFKNKNIPTNATVIFTPLQAMIAASSGANYLSPYLGRLESFGHNALGMLEDLALISKNYNYTAEIIVASIRTIRQVFEVAKYGADIVTVPFSIIQQMLCHPLTDLGIKQFLDDWKKVSD